MDIAARQHPRARAQSYLERDTDSATNESSGESETFSRRKFQRTSVNPDPTPNTFRKPSIPASATKPAGLEQQRASVASHRRKNTRDNVRIPSGPREYPSPGKRTSSLNSPVVPSSASSTHSFLPQIASEPLFGNELSRFSVRQRDSSSSNNTDLQNASAGGLDNSLDYIPTVNFDDLQTSIAAYDGSKPLLRDAPTMPGQRGPRKENESMSMNTTDPYTASRHVLPGIGAKESDTERPSNFRRQLAAVSGLSAGLRANSGQTSAQTPPSASQPNLAVRTRRQSSLPQTMMNPTQQAQVAAGRQPRKSLGPGVLTNMMESRKVSQPTPTTADPKPSIPRTNSLSTGRRPNLPTSASTGTELPRLQALQSRANKVRSMQPLPREQEPNTPNSVRHLKGVQSREQTPSSSGHKRQSTMSGRASGLGARTVSPTDARRLKRLSMMHAPPMPTNHPKGPPTPQDDSRDSFIRPDLPRVAQPSPSFIPVKAQSNTPNSARASPEGRQSVVGGISLNSKSSFQSLLSNTGSTSRLPTPKPRHVHSSSAQYDDEEEVVPPVPAIPKAYESPKEHETPFFSSYSSKQNESQSDYIGQTADRNAFTPSATSHKQGGSMDASRTLHQRSASGDHRRHHQRTRTIDRTTAPPTTGTNTNKPHPDATGRKNNSLQPLRLPPLNLNPINSNDAPRNAGLPYPSQEVNKRDTYMSVQTPEPKRIPKTPSTPMTASRATFFKRQDDEMKAKGIRSSTSHYALRDMMQLDDATARFFEDSDNDLMGSGAGVPIPNAKHRSAITPFTSGSLPKAAGQFSVPQGRPSGEYSDEYDMTSYSDLLTQSSKQSVPRPKTTAGAPLKIPKSSATPSSLDSPVADSSPSLPDGKDKKDGSTGGALRRRLSLGWRRSSSKSAIHVDNIPSPQEVQAAKSKRSSEMPPPKLPASASSSWSNGAVQTLPPPRASFESVSKIATANRRKSTFSTIQTNGSTDTLSSTTNGGGVPTLGGNKTKDQNGDQPKTANIGSRASSWGHFGTTTALRQPTTASKPTTNGTTRSRTSATVISAIVKDKDDLSADDEMRRLSQKRRDVDTAARESEQLKARAVARSPMTADRVLHDRTYQLNIFERGEIVDYDKEGIFFTGTKTAKKVIGAVSATASAEAKAGNYGYDDERGDYNIVMGDHLAYRYEVVDLLGKGSFGQVVRCVDHKDGGVVAVKIIRNKKRFHQQALVEVGILGKLGDWDPDGSYATLSLTSSFYFRSHLCIVTPCLSINLYELIRAHNFVGFPLPLIRRFSRQLLACLVLLQQKKIIHCDLKPENILLCEARKADVRVIDFGSSCREEEKVYTYIQSRFYRSPEVILGSSYGLGIDMWSLGCILAELLTGYPIFPGENEQEQLACIMEIFGPPDRHLVERCTRKKLFFDSVGKPRVTVSSKGRRRRPSSKTLAQALRTDDEAFLDFVSRCLRWDPDRRLKPSDAVTHPFITNSPMNQRGGIPDEARRAARVRSTVGVPGSTTGGTFPSPTKRSTTGNSSTTSTTATPVRNRAQADAQPSLRAPPASTKNDSPAKLGVNRRHSTIVTAGGAAGNKRVSNGAALSSMAPPPQPALSLAQMAARESMTGAAPNRTKGTGGGL